MSVKGGTIYKLLEDKGINRHNPGRTKTDGTIPAGKGLPWTTTIDRFWKNKSASGTYLKLNYEADQHPL